MLRWSDLWWYSCRSYCTSGNKELQKSGDRVIENQAPQIANGQMTRSGNTLQRSGWRHKIERKRCDFQASKRASRVRGVLRDSEAARCFSVFKPVPLAAPA